MRLNLKVLGALAALGLLPGCVVHVEPVRYSVPTVYSPPVYVAPRYVPPVYHYRAPVYRPPVYRHHHHHYYRRW